MIRNYKKFFESKNKFPDIKKIEVDGYFIMVGRDAKSNDYLTFNMAENDDIWMHVKGVPGSHVVIRIKDKLPTQEILKFAADLAKKNSKAKNENQATVVYCKRRFVTKGNNMNPGQVRVDYVNSHEIVV
jgi:predicted ribosome quality control (RQC) complex YloA/Tae2 family protein